MTEPIHRLTGKPMAHCPRCGHLSGLSGIDGGPCLACMGWGEHPLDDEADEDLHTLLADLLDTDGCFVVDGYCNTHDWSGVERPCPQGRLRAFLESRPT
jgi:hypothetical protein